MSRWPSRPRAFRDWPLTGGQKQDATDFISDPPITGTPRDVYEEAFAIEVEIDAVKTGQVLAGSRFRQRHVRALRRRVRQLVSAPRQAAGPSRLEVQRAALRYVRYCGGVEHLNITAFVRYVHSKPGAERVYSSGKSRKLTDHAIREILKRRLGIVGQRGRKRKIP
jgi:hypothetical protein